MITEYEQNRTYAGKSTSGPVPVEARQSYEPVAGGTRITFIAEMQPGGFFKLAEPLVMNLVKRQGEADAATLKALMEAGDV